MKRQRYLFLFLLPLLFVLVMGCFRETEYKKVRYCPKVRDNLSFVQDKPFYLKIKEKDGYRYYYTLDGSTPTKKSARYNGRVEIKKSGMFKIIGFKGKNRSMIYKNFYIITSDVENIIKSGKKVKLRYGPGELVYIDDKKVEISSDLKLFSKAYYYYRSKDQKSIDHVVTEYTMNFMHDEWKGREQEFFCDAYVMYDKYGKITDIVKIVPYYYYTNPISDKKCREMIEAELKKQTGKDYFCCDDGYDEEYNTYFATCYYGEEQGELGATLDLNTMKVYID